MILGKKYVWYAAYGSNMNTDRMLCYIQGRKPEFANCKNRGCTDKSLPIKVKSRKFKGKLFFERSSDNWNGSAVCFVKVSDMKDTLNYFYTKLYLITEEQFIEIAKQEGADDVLLDEVIKSKGIIKNDRCFYGDIVYLGKTEGYPIVTFTSERFYERSDAFKIEQGYLFHVIKGLSQINVPYQKAIDYLFRTNISRFKGTILSTFYDYRHLFGV